MGAAEPWRRPCTPRAPGGTGAWPLRSSPRSRLSPHPASCAQGSGRHEGDLGQPHLPWWEDKDSKTSATEK